MYKTINNTFDDITGYIFKENDKTFVLQKLNPAESIQLDIDFQTLSNNEFEDKYNIIKENVITYGDTNDNILARILSLFINKYDIEYRDNSTTDKNHTVIKHKLHYDCFIIHDFLDNRTPIHEDIRSSWNCLLKKYNNPKYIIIYTIDNRSKYKFKKIKFD